MPRKQEYVDERGVTRLVFVPDNGYAVPEEGIPADMVDLIDGLYPDAPESFLVKLHDALRRRGLVQPADYLQPGAGDRYRSAMLEVLRHDAHNVIAKAKEITQ